MDEQSDNSDIEESEVIEEQNECAECGTSDEEILDETECTCENDSDDENDECESKCVQQKKAVKRKDTDCTECDIVEKVVAELIKKECEEEEEAKKTPEKPEPPKKKKPLYKFRGFGRRNNDNTTFEVIETEHGRFRGCCRHKVEHIEGLPQYQGAVSVYGLSEKQYEKREERLKHIEQKQLEKFEKTTEEYVQKSVQNEDAFEKWLKQKTKSKVNRKQNMYDYKPKPQRPKIQQRTYNTKISTNKE